MEAIEALRGRRSVRAYEAGKTISKETLETLVDCGRLAATGRNVQPWEFIVITEPNRLRQVADITEYGKFIANCSACIAVVCENTKYYIEDGAAATQNIMVAAWSLGIGSCWVAGDKKDYADRLRQILGAPDTHKLLSLIALGYAAKVPAPPKRPLAEVLHWEQY